MSRDSTLAQSSLFSRRLLWLVGGAAILLAQLALVAEEEPSTKSYSYGGIDGNEHEILAYFPAGHQSADRRPCYVFFHGGGWKSGDLKQGKSFCEYLASRGIVALTANYSMHAKTKDALPK